MKPEKKDRQALIMEHASSGEPPVPELASSADEVLHDEKAIGSLQETIQQHERAQAETSDYLEKQVAIPLSLGLAAVVRAQPLDAVSYLIQWLRHYVKHEQQKDAFLKEQEALESLRRRMQLQHEAEEKERTAAASKLDAQGLTKEDRKFLKSLESVEWMGEKEFQKTLDYVCSAVEVCGVYVARLYSDGDLSGQAIQYICADKHNKFLVDSMLLEEEGVLWDALAQADEEEETGQKEDEASTEDDEDGENYRASGDDGDAEDQKPPAAYGDDPINGSRDKPKTTFIPDVMAEEKVKFWRMTRPGSLAIVPMIFEDAACKESVELMKEYLLEVKERDRIIEERNGAREKARSAKEKSRQGAGGAPFGTKGSLVNDGDSEEEEVDETTEEEELPPPVLPPVLTSKTVKMLFCVDTLGMQNALALDQLRRVEKFAIAVRERCIATREAAVKRQAEVLLNEEKLRESAAEIESVLEEEENEAAAEVESEKEQVAREVEAKLEKERQEREARKQAYLEKLAEQKRRREEERERQKEERQRKLEEKRQRRLQREEERQRRLAAAQSNREAADDSSEAQQQGTSGESGSEEDQLKTEDREDEDHEDGGEGEGEGNYTEQTAEDDEGESDTEGEADEPEAEANEDEAQEEEAEELEEEAEEPLDASIFLEEAEGKVKFERATKTLTARLGDRLLELNKMFIPTVPSVIPITAACLLLLGDSAASLRVNSNIPESSFDWQKIRSRICPRLLLRMSTFDPKATRHADPLKEASFNQEVTPLHLIGQLIEESAESEEKLLELCPPLYILQRWVELAVDYRRRHLAATAVNLYREAKMKKKAPPLLEEEVDPDFAGLQLDHVLASMQLE
ncbi:hypothetical protein CSUI_005669 [Cystoisospora suis]|uniref:Uncharacterized protein n=1 Tax=Cystoisospora suis TaxID=483139 RepID=A0A2C6KWT4_9APIC|nr:hypothetical protein CSUI_005669 [Cystoisospora suis]